MRMATTVMAGDAVWSQRVRVPIPSHSRLAQNASSLPSRRRKNKAQDRAVALLPPHITPQTPSKGDVVPYGIGVAAGGATAHPKSADVDPTPPLPMSRHRDQTLVDFGVQEHPPNQGGLSTVMTLPV